nr:hypothetical protein HUO10_003015 [Paraburkholderia busanensis]
MSRSSSTPSDNSTLDRKNKRMNNLNETANSLTIQKNSIPWRKIIDTLKEGASIGKDITDLALKASILLLIVPGLAIWSYLDRIGWKSLFLDSISSMPGLLTLLAGTLLLLSLLLFLLCTPSIFLFGAAAMGREYDFLPKRAALVILLTILVWFTLIFIGSLIGIGVSVVFIIAFTFIVCLALSVGGNRTDANPRRFGWNRIGRAIIFAAPATIAVISTSIPFLTMETFVGSMDTNAKAARALAVLIPLTLVGCLPGLMAIGSMTYKKSIFRAAKFAGIGTGLALYVLLAWSAAVSTGISTRALEKIGVYSTAPETFEVLKADVQTGLARIGIAPVPDTPLLVKTYVRFAFGDIRLLCATPFNPGVTDGMENIFSNDRAAKEKSRNIALAAGRNCIVTKKDDVRSISLPVQ